MAKNRVSDFDTTAGNNTDVQSVSIAEGMAPSGVNNAMRAQMSSIAEWWKQMNSVLTTGGTSTAFTLTPAVALPAYTDGEQFTFKLHTTNSAGATLNISGLGAKKIRKFVFSGNERDLSSTDLLPNQPVIVQYSSAANGGAGAFIVLSSLASTTFDNTDVIPLNKGGTNKSLTAAAGGVVYTDADSMEVLAAGTSGYFLKSGGSTISWDVNPSKRLFSTKTAAYTIVAGDHNKVIRWTTALCNANFDPAANLGDGFVVHLRNDASTDAVSIDPNGAETIDGVTSRNLQPGAQVTIGCNGSTFFTLNGMYTFRSSTISMTAGTQHSVNHGLGKVPDMFWARIRCTDAAGDAGYAQNDEILVMDSGDVSTSVQTANVGADATGVWCTIGTGGLQGLNKTTGAVATITLSKWRLLLFAWTY